MTATELHCMPDDRHILRKRLARYVQPIPAKVLARKIGCDVRTAENIRKGHWPLAVHWLGLVGAFGRDVTEAVFHPDAATARLTEEVAELETRLAERRAALRLVAEGHRSFAPRVAQAETKGRAEPD